MGQVVKRRGHQLEGCHETPQSKKKNNSSPTPMRRKGRTRAIVFYQNTIRELFKCVPDDSGPFFLFLLFPPSLFPPFQMCHHLVNDQGSTEQTGPRHRSRWNRS